MDVKQEVSEERCKIEIYYNDLDDAILDSFKSEIKEEFNKESIPDTYDYLVLKTYTRSSETVHDESRLKMYEENQKTEKGCPQEENKMEIMETLTEHSSHEGNYMSQHAEGKTLNEIMKVRTEQRPYKCDICFRRFSGKSNLKKHLMVHTGEKPYKCEICFKQFTDISNMKKHLKTHLRVHTQEKPYMCEICFKQFREAGSLKIHLRVHTGEKPYKCEICFKKFTQKGSLDVHTKFTLEKNLTSVKFVLDRLLNQVI
ncbi:uncharacterized protein [Diabrotica undecimpunctata]|uniref:uncharacterized protein n=1 Tax=Diabrotica undecimpunctata TaxID=50387 RepID=UPI003B638968